MISIVTWYTRDVVSQISYKSVFPNHCAEGISLLDEFAKIPIICATPQGEMIEAS